MAYEVKAHTNILKYNAGWVAMPVTVTNTGIVADSDGKKIIPAGTPLEASSGTIRTAGSTAKACATGANAEGLLFNEVDVTAGSVTGSMLIEGTIDGPKLPSMPTGTAAALKPFGIHIIGAYTEA